MAIHGMFNCLRVQNPAEAPRESLVDYEVGVPSTVSSETRLDVSQRSSTSWSMPHSQFQVRMRRTRSR